MSCGPRWQRVTHPLADVSPHLAHDNHSHVGLCKQAATKLTVRVRMGECVKHSRENCHPTFHVEPDKVLHFMLSRTRYYIVP